MGQALYRKYRSKSLSEVIGQEHITDTLEAALKSGHISHAYLFTGPRGVGKTSIARILAHEINQLPYADDQIHLDIIEIDAASNRRIDEIRELRDKVSVAPTSAAYKVYIIDEVHMLTKEAFNALLKTLEEPPKHVVFILATTEIHKLPETIVSRTQRFTFKPVTQEKVIAHLRNIAKQEKVKISDDALTLIAQYGEGSFRDSIGLLDQASGHTGEVDLTFIQSLIGMPPTEIMDNLATSLLTHDSRQVVQTLAQLHEQGYQSARIAKQLGVVWRDKILENKKSAPEDFALLQKLLGVPSAHNPERYLEIILLEFALTQPPTQASNTISTATPTPEIKLPEVKSKADTPPPSTPTPKTGKITEVAKEQKPVAARIESNISAILDEAVWPQVLAELKKKYNTLYGVVRMAQPNFQGDTLQLGFAFAFHRKRLSEAKNQKIVADIIQDLTGQLVIIKCIDSKSTPDPAPAAEEIAQPSIHITEPSPQTETSNIKPDISAISNIFGGGELLES